MRAACWHGRQDIHVEHVPDPKILNPGDAIVRITSTAICGSDLHLYNGFIPSMEKGDILGHEFMGEVVEVGRGVKNLKVGDRVVVPFPIACGHCVHVRARALFAVRELQPERLDGREAVGHSPARHLRLLAHAGRLSPAGRPNMPACPLPMSGRSRCRTAAGRAGAVPVGHLPDRLHGRRDCATSSAGDVVAVWGCGPVGQFAIKSAFMLGAERVIAIDRFPYRLRMARETGRAPRRSTTRRSTVLGSAARR